jgi:hypothetical protein
MVPTRPAAIAALVLVWSQSWTAVAAAPPAAGPQARGNTAASAAPSVRVSVLPPANRAGWHDAAVRLVYTCVSERPGAVACPAEAMIETEGRQQKISGVARDTEGREATAGVTLSIDRTPPVLHMTSPAQGQVVTGTTVTVTGTATDGLSGVAGARCNGAPATVTRGGTISCTVAVRPGFNAVVLQASDAAGKTATAGVRVTVAAAPTAVSIVPHGVTLVPGEHRRFRLQDEYGVPVSGAKWTADESGALSAAQAGDDVEITAVSVGSATVRANWNGLTAATLVTVATPRPEGGLPYGTVRWSLEKLDPAATQKAFVARRVEPKGPSFLVLDAAPRGSVLRCLSLDGLPMSAWQLPAETRMVLPDRDNGVLLITSQPRGLLRVPGVEAEQPWWYVPEGAREIEAGVQAPDGTIFALETANDDLGTRTLVGLDGRTGALRFRIASLGRQHTRVLDGDGPGSVVEDVVSASPMHPLIFGYDDAAYLGTFSRRLVLDRAAGQRSDHVEALLMRVETDGAARETVMESRDAVRRAHQPALGVTMGPIVPDPRGGAHIEWTFSNDDLLPVPRHGRGSFAGPPTSASGPLPFTRVGDVLTGFDDAGNAYDMETYALKFSTPPGSAFVATLAGGGVAYRIGDVLFETDAAGTVIKTSSMPGMPSDARPIR